MINLEKVKNFFSIKKEKIKIFIKKNKKSYVLYIFATILFCVLFIIALISPESFNLLLFKKNFQFSFLNLIVYSIALLIILLFLIGFVLDLYYFWKFIREKIPKLTALVGSILYIIFVYPISQVFAKNLIYNITHENPDFYQIAIQVLSNFYILIGWILLLPIIFIIIYLLLAAFNIIMSILDMLSLKMLLHFLDKVFMRLNIRKSHLFFTLIGSAFFIWFFLPISQVLINKTNKYIFNFANSSILYISYYPNKVCKNIPKGVYIKLLGTNDVLVTNINSFNMILFNDTNKKITFKHLKCERKE